MIRLLLIFSLLGPLVTLPTVAAAQVDTGEFRNYQGECLGRLFQWLPPVVIQSSELALDKVSVRHSDGFSLNIPLKQPHGPITELHETSFKDLDSTLEFLRLLQAGKVGHLGVDSFDRYNALRGLSKQDAQGGPVNWCVNGIRRQPLDRWC